MSTFLNQKTLGCELIAAAVDTIKAWSSPDYSREQSLFLNQLFPSWKRLPHSLDLISALDTIYSSDLEQILEDYDLSLNPCQIRAKAAVLYAASYARINAGYVSRHLSLPTPDDLANWAQWVEAHRNSHMLFSAPGLYFAQEAEEIVEHEEHDGLECAPQLQTSAWTQGVLL
jgi:hypothetical protein